MASMGWTGGDRSPPARLYSGLRRFGGDLLLDELAIALEPVLRLHQLAALDGPDLDPAAALMVGRRQFHRRHEAAQCEVLHRFHTLLHVLARRCSTTFRLDGVAHGF